VASDHGEPLQYSVFVCDLTREELIALKAALLAEIKSTEDSVGIFDLGTPAGRGVRCIEFLGVRRDLPSDGPAIW
jgi:CRISPR-associated protein Cas2